MTSTNGEKLDYLVIVRPEPATDGSLIWFAYHPDLPGCMAHGDSAEEAVANLAEARAMVLHHLRERGIEPPPPGSSKVAQAILAGI